LAEEHDWDGVFLWDHVLYHQADWPLMNSVVIASAMPPGHRVSGWAC